MRYMAENRVRVRVKVYTRLNLFCNKIRIIIWSGSG